MWAWALIGLVAADWTWGRWVTEGLKPAVRSGHAAVEVDGKVYVIGGCLLDVQCFNDVHIFDPKTDTWSQPALSGDAPEPRGGHSATLVGASIFVFGGSSPVKTFADAFELDLLTRRWKRCAAQTPFPTARTGHAADFDGEGNILIHGGYGGDGRYLDDLWLLNVFYPSEWVDQATTPVTWTMTVTVGKAPSPRESHSLTVVRGRAYVFGGYTVDGLTQDLSVLALDSMKWELAHTSGAGPTARQGHSASRHGDSLVIVGGCQVSPQQCFGDVFSLDTKTLAWTSRSTDQVTFSPREGHTATFIRGDLVVIGGCELFSQCYNDVTVLETSDPCPGSCGGQGACQGKGAAAFCQCVPGFTGHDCLTPVPCPFNCNGHGQCLSTGRCACDNGFGGTSCEVAYQSASPKTVAESRFCI
jgi:host cell factor